MAAIFLIYLFKNTCNWLKKKNKKENLYSADAMDLDGWDAVGERWGNVSA